MQTQDFNAESAIGKYAYRLSPIHERSFQILKKHAADTEAEPVGDYIVLDGDECVKLAEKKVTNLVALLNGRKRLMALGEETKSRVLFNVVNDGSNGEKTKVIFYHLGTEGVSKENALFMLEGDDHVIN